MSSTSNISISLQSHTPSKSGESNKYVSKSDSNNGTYQSEFNKALEKVASNQPSDKGKELPQDVTEKGRQVPGEKIQFDLKSSQIRKVGMLNLLTTPANSTEVSDESLISFMQDQGFSRADMAQLLIFTPERQSVNAESTTDWLKVKSGDLCTARLQSIDEKIELEELRSISLADALAAQLIKPRNSEKSSAISEVLAVKNITHHLKAKLSSEASDQMTIKLNDLLPAFGKKPMSGRTSNHGGSLDSGTLSSNQFDAKTLSELPKGPEMRDFREYLAEHLRRTESLRELTDRLGGMVARQITGQIGRGRWSLEIAMHPAELGSIKIEMEMTERGLEASFRASHSVTRDLLMDSMPRLKSWFEEGGIDVAYTGLTQEFGARNGGNSTGEHSAKSEFQATESDETSDAIDMQVGVDDSVGLDIRV